MKKFAGRPYHQQNCTPGTGPEPANEKDREQWDIDAWGFSIHHCQRCGEVIKAGSKICVDCRASVAGREQAG